MDNHARAAADARSILERDTRATIQLLELLGEERNALQQRDAEHLNSIVTKKLACLAQLEQHDGERKQLLARTRCEDWPSLISQLDPEGLIGLSPLWQELVVRLREIAELLEINARIVNRARRSTERLLALLRGQTDPIGVYDRRGKTQAYGDNRAITSA